MKIKDIVNRDLVNLTNCEHEPIHIPGSIQPHGFLLAIHKAHDTIDFCSGNVESFLHVTPSQLLGKDFTAVFGKEARQHIAGYFLNSNEQTLLKIILANHIFECSLHDNGSHYILEGELQQLHTIALSDFYSQTSQFVSYMNDTNTLQELCDLVAKGTREITGYDRVMVYRFDKEYNGEVFAECCREDLEPFLGLHYPHTDIPPQARALYLKNLSRLIADINYTPVPIYTIDDQPGKNLDLSLSVLRSTSPIHVEYLKNMGVGATLTISLIHRGQLWGLIACHHYSYKNLTPEIRLAAQLQGQFITSQIDVRQINEEYELSRRTNIVLERLNAVNLPPVAESFRTISNHPDLMALCNAAGVSLLIDGKIYKSGLTPEDGEIRKLSDYFFNYSGDTSFVTHKLVDVMKEKESVCELISGIIYHSLGNGNSIVWYRPETITEVSWAGDPNKAIVRDEKGLHPRNSFNQWKEVVKCSSSPWLQPETNAAANYAHALEKQISLMLLSREEEKSRTLNEVLRETNGELENINWISTHDLQEPLRKIQLISSRFLDKEDEAISKQLLDGLQRMNGSANRMQTLLTDILKYTRIKHVAEAFEAADLNLIFDEVMTEHKDIIAENGMMVQKSELPVVNGIPFLLKQLLSNIILNSLKYQSEQRTPQLQIDWQRGDQLFDVVGFKDNGIGFEQQYAESIFKIFNRLHGPQEYKGSGVGLALCKKIMQTHEGNITATGFPGSGALFTLYFPKK